MKIVDKLSAEDVLERLESHCVSSVDFMPRQVTFCARWSLDNLCTWLRHLRSVTAVFDVHLSSKSNVLYSTG